MKQHWAVRFWEKVDVLTEKECWPWRGGKTSDGYGRFSIEGVDWLAHRVMYLLEKTEGRTVEDRLRNKIGSVKHTCRIKGCCNPHHLYLEGD